VKTNDNNSSQDSADCSAVFRQDQRRNFPPATGNILPGPAIPGKNFKTSASQIFETKTTTHH